MVLITARMGRIGINLQNRGDRRVISKRGSLYILFVACLRKNVEDFIEDTHHKLMPKGLSISIKITSGQRIFVISPSVSPFSVTSISIHISYAAKQILLVRCDIKTIRGCVALGIHDIIY